MRLALCILAASYKLPTFGALTYWKIKPIIRSRTGHKTKNGYLIKNNFTKKIGEIIFYAQFVEWVIKRTERKRCKIKGIDILELTFYNVAHKNDEQRGYRKWSKAIENGSMNYLMPVDTPRRYIKRYWRLSNQASSRPMMCSRNAKSSSERSCPSRVRPRASRRRFDSSKVI